MTQPSWVATIVATLLGFVLGAIWYGPLFANAWMEENGFKREELMAGFNPVKTYGITFVIGLVSAYVFGVFIGPKPEMPHALTWSLLIGVVWVMGSISTNYLFERRSLRLQLINGGYHAVRFLLVGLAFAMLG